MASDQKAASLPERPSRVREGAWTPVIGRVWTVAAGDDFLTVQGV